MEDLAIGCRDALTESIAREALATACERVGLAVGEPELIRMGSNAVFRLGTETIARVAVPGSAMKNASKQIAVSRWLEAIRYSATRALDVDQPVQSEKWVVTFWESIAPEPMYAQIGQVAYLIRKLHELSPPPASVDLPALRPFGASDDPLPRFVGLDDTDAAYLHEQYAWARQRFAAIDFPLKRGVVHGDANVGNVLVDPHGQAVLIDLDSFSIGPREWDLIQTALFADRLGWHTADEYRTFVEVYGYDITRWDGYETLANMREIAMTAWLSKKAAGDEKAAAEAHKRITAMRTGGSRRDWGAY